ncbi:flagellar hook-basal body complex protein FliE [Modestobacter lapidis]|nr:flagellar hook-basal body complex protein FliE [Modestobacter lapidis]
MTSPISAIGMGIPIPSFGDVAGAAGVTGTTGTSAAAPVGGDNGFADVLAGAVDRLNGVQANASDLAVQAATGDLRDAHDYMIASAEAKLATETVVTLKNAAVGAFTEIMRMPV